MKKILLISFLIICFSGFSQTTPVATGNHTTNTFSQKSSITSDQPFDLKKAYAEARAKGIRPTDIEGYVQSKKHEYVSAKALSKQAHQHTPYEPSVTGFQEAVIYLTPNQPQSVGCSNMGFDQYNFAGWTGGIGTISTGTLVGGNPLYTPTGTSIVNTAGNNTSVVNATNYHTLMTRPTTTNNIYPNCSSFGYDSVATRAIGSSLISDIPFVSPFSLDPVSVRMNGALANYRGCRLKYIATTSPNSRQLTFSYAVVLQDGGHAAESSAYFKVEVRNETTGALLPGCTSYTYNPVSSQPSDSLKFTASPGYNSTIEPVSYRKWQLYSVDLSSLPFGTNVSVNFEVGSCDAGGHIAYAYVDAECGAIAAPYANMCTGATYATLVAPQGFNTYQWFNPSNVPIVGATNDTLIINSPTNGSIYTVQMVSPGGCMVTATVSLVPTTVNIANINSTSSCAGGNSGTAFVQATGSNSGYTYMWTSTSGPNIGTVVSVGQYATGLAPGTYSVVVSSPGCGQASANLSVGVTPPQFYTQGQSFCGNATALTMPGGSNYYWYNGSNPVGGPAGTNDTLYISPAVNGSIYHLTYTNSLGCRDSVRFILNQLTGGDSYLSNIVNVCPGNTNGSATLNLTTPFVATYTYSVKSTTAVITTTSTTSPTLTLTPLAPGSYTATIKDGTCLYMNSFTIAVIPTDFTVTATNTVLCLPGDTAKIKIGYGTAPPNFCGTDPTVCSPGGMPNTLFTSGPFFNNSTTTYPSPYSGNHYSGKHQFLVKAADLNAAGLSAGKISSLAFNVTNLNSSATTYSNYQIKMGCSNTTAFVSSGTGPSFATAGMQTVYSNTTQSVTAGWLTHQFNQAYVWDGSSNLIIEVCSGGANTSSGNPSFEMKQMSYIANMRSLSTTPGAGSCPATVGNGNGTLMNNGDYMLPNMKFGYCAYSPPASSYTVNVSPGSIGHNYGNDSLTVIPPFTIPPTNNQPVTYTISVTNPIGGCVATRTLSILYPSLSNTVIATPTQSTICIGASVNLSASGTILYNWYHVQNGTPAPISTNSTITVTPPSAGTHTYVVSGSSPCPSAVPDTKTITINVLPKANLQIAPLLDVTKCMDRPYVFSANASSGTPGNQGTPYTYNWTTLPGNNPAPGVNTASSYTAQSNSTTTLVVTVNGQCANAGSDTVVISNFVNDLMISILDSSTVSCANTPLILTASISGGYPHYTFGWFFDGNPNAISTSTTVTFTSPGTQGDYGITVYVSDSCGYSKSSHKVMVVLPPCVIEIPNVITPNGDAANEFFKIKNLELHPNTNVAIFDRWGRKVYENADYQNEWRAEGVSDGTFFYVIDVPDDKKYSGFVTVFRK